MSAMSQYVRRAADVRDMPDRPGMRGRNLMATEHGVTSLFVFELVMEHGSSIPLHAHATEEVFFVTNGALVMQIGDETVLADAQAVVCIPAGTPHSVRNDANESAYALTAGAWNRATFFSDATTYLEGTPRTG